MDALFFASKFCENWVYNHVS